MKQSKLLLQTYRKAPRDADFVSQQLMMRAGMIQKLAAGIYDYLPLALRSIRKFEDIVREELNRDGCQELLMPTVQPRVQGPQGRGLLPGTHARRGGHGHRAQDRQEL